VYSYDYVNFVIYFTLPFILFFLLFLYLQFSVPGFFFDSAFAVSKIIVFSKIFVICVILVIFILSLDYFKSERLQLFEYPIIILLSTLGMFILISANDFIVFYLALELQSFCFYILASLKRYSNLSIEAALKYFILGSFSSGVFLFGISLLYAFYGTINFTEINQLIFFSDIYFTYFSVATFGLFFISVGLLFKLAIFPFHF